VSPKDARIEQCARIPDSFGGNPDSILQQQEPQRYEHSADFLFLVHGPVSSILIWMDSYFIVRYGPVGETIAPRTLWGAVLIGLLAATFLAFYIPLVKGRTMRTKA
jgi:hypothetical protein